MALLSDADIDERLGGSEWREGEQIVSDFKFGDLLPFSGGMGTGLRRGRPSCWPWWRTPTTSTEGSGPSWR